jgi:2-hydroxychromene-2-carboxylate isomerase
MYVMTQKTIDYYFVPQSPWTYLGHARLVQLAQKYSARINVLPMDLGKIFPVSGGLPLAKRAPQRQANRLVELARFRDHLGLPLHVHPEHFPVAGDPAALVIISVQAKDGWQAALAVASKVLSGVWADERNIADASTLKAMLAECGLPESRYEESLQPEIQALYDQNTQAALDANVFGAPTYIVDGELFWGQDRLDFVERKLAA